MVKKVVNELTSCIDNISYVVPSPSLMAVYDGIRHRVLFFAIGTKSSFLNGIALGLDRKDKNRTIIPIVFIEATKSIRWGDEVFTDISKITYEPTFSK